MFGDAAAMMQLREHRHASRQVALRCAVFFCVMTSPAAGGMSVYVWVGCWLMRLPVTGNSRVRVGFEGAPFLT